MRNTTMMMNETITRTGDVLRRVITENGVVVYDVQFHVNSQMAEDLREGGILTDRPARPSLNVWD